MPHAMTSSRSDNPRAETAQRMIDRGYFPLVLITLSKRPVDLGWQNPEASCTDVARRLRWNPEKNLGWRMGTQPNGKRLLAVDDDGGLRQLAALLGPLPVTWSQQTPSGGGHLVFRVPAEAKLGNRVRVAKQAIDVRCDRGYIVAAPSELDDRDKQTPGIYIAEPRAIAELPAPWLTALREVEQQPPPPLPTHLEPSLERALRYTAHCEPAVAGQGGHAATFRVACKAVEFGLSISDTLVVLREYNRRCDPPWDEMALRHKAEQAHGVGRVVRGGKLAKQAANARARNAR